MGSKKLFAFHNIAVEIGGFKPEDCTKEVRTAGTGRKVFCVFQYIDERSLKSTVLLRILRRNSICKISVNIGFGDPRGAKASRIFAF
jgi:hypothetical protein